MTIQNPPVGYQVLSPYLHVENAEAAIAFYTTVFGAAERFRLPIPTPDGTRIGHAELTLGASVLMLSDMCPDNKKAIPTPKGDVPPVSLMIYVPDVDTTIAKAVENGAILAQPATDQFYGDRSGVIRDPYGLVWNIATHIRDVSHEEMQQAVKNKAGG